MKSRRPKSQSKTKYRSSQIYLERIFLHIKQIKKYKNGLSAEVFNKQEKDYDAICMQLSQIGENVAKIEKCQDLIIEKFPNAVNWKGLKGLRNRIDHDYTWLESEKVWEMLGEELDRLEFGIKEILKKRFSK